MKEITVWFSFVDYRTTSLTRSQSNLRSGKIRKVGMSSAIGIQDEQRIHAVEIENREIHEVDYTNFRLETFS